MRRSSAFLVLFALVAFGCDLGGACAMALTPDAPATAHGASEGCCCCPGACDAPCMEDEDEAPQPPQHIATLDGPTSFAVLADAPAAYAAPDPRAAVGPAPVRDPSAGTGPAIYLLACSFLN